MVTLYSTHCPRCNVLKMKLDQSHIDYSVVDDPDKVVEAGKEANIKSAPFLKVDDAYLDFKAGCDWVKEQK